MRFNDAILGGLIIAFSIFIIVESWSYPALPGVPYGPGLFPTIIAGCMILGGCVLIYKGLRRVPAEGWYALESWARKPRTYVTLALIFAALLFYILFSRRLGFPITAMLILFPLMLWTRGRAHAVSSLVIAVIFSFVVYFIFAEWMRVPLPEGMLRGIL